MAHDIAFYLELGFDEQSAAYFATGRRRAKKVAARPDKTLLVTFDNDEMRVYDMGPCIQPGTVFSFLADDDAFRRAYIDENNDIAWDVDPSIDSKIVWNNKVDISADTCYLEGTAA